jgi:hypothetical protein
MGARFKARDVGPFDSRHFSQLVLGQSSFFPNFFYTLADAFTYLGIRCSLFPDYILKRRSETTTINIQFTIFNLQLSACGGSGSS